LVQRRVIQLQDSVCVSGPGASESSTHLFLGWDTSSSL